MTSKCTCADKSVKGCAYHAEWMRLKRAKDPEYRRKQLEGSRRWREANPADHREASQAWYSANADHVKALRQKRRRHYRNYALRSQYGITIDDYEQKLEAQGGVCGICTRPEPVPNRSLSVDHCHASGSVRGLLCTDCNTALGRFGDSPSRLRSAAKWVEEGGFHELSKPAAPGQNGEERVYS